MNECQTYDRALFLTALKTGLEDLDYRYLSLVENLRISFLIFCLLKGQR